MRDIPIDDEFSIGQLGPDELPRLLPLLEELAAYHNRVAEAFAGRYPLFPIAEQLADAREEMLEERARVEILRRDGTVVGFSKASFKDDHGEIDYLLVHESLRGKGLGRLLMDRMMAYLRESGVAFIELRVVQGNPARNFYEGYGFRARSLLMARDL